MLPLALRSPFVEFTVVTRVLKSSILLIAIMILVFRPLIAFTVLTITFICRFGGIAVIVIFI